MIFGWKKSGNKKKEEKISLPYPASPEEALIRFENVSLPPTIQDLSLEIPLGSWLMLFGEDDFAKALFCDLCFSYILPDSGRVHPVLKGSDVSFLGRSNTTYGRTLLDHLRCGVTEQHKERIDFVASQALSPRFRRHLSPEKPLEFSANRQAREVDMDERDFLEVAEANLLLQNRKAAVIDTTSDFYRVAMEQGFRHSALLLQSGKTLIWIIDEKNPLPQGVPPWSEKSAANVKRIELSFPSGSRVGYLN